MSVAYIPVQWNRNKWFYDAVLLGIVVVYAIFNSGVNPLINSINSNLATSGGS